MAPHTDYYSPNQRAYLDYYTTQAGGGLNRYRGGEQSGYGIASILGSIIRKIIPVASSLVRPAAHIVKPHLKAAARDLTVAAVKKITRAVKKRKQSKKTPQAGGRRKRRKGTKKKKSSRRRRTAADIFS